MTIVSRDEWHTVEVGVPLVFKDDDGNVDWTEQQVLVKHGSECIRSVSVEEVKPDVKVTHIEYGCNLVVDGEFYGQNDWIKDVVGLAYGVWRVQAYSTRDHHGEYDVEYNIERLEGPVDGREFEINDDDCDCIGFNHSRDCEYWEMPR